MIEVAPALLALSMIGVAPPGPSSATPPAATIATIAPETPAAPAATAAPALLATGDASHLWFVGRLDGRITLFHAGEGMPEGDVRAAANLPSGAPVDMSNFGPRVELLFPARSAILPRAHLLSLSARQHPTSGRWFSVPSDRFDLLPALPETSEVESLASLAEGPVLLHHGGSSLWRLRRGEWQAIVLPPDLATSSPRRLERGGSRISVLARTAADRGWERWSLDEDRWDREAIGVPEQVELQPIGGPNDLALDDRPDRRLLYLPADGPIVLAEFEGNDAVAWFRASPRLIAEGSPAIMRTIDPVNGTIAAPRPMSVATTRIIEWIHLPILGASLVAILMIVFFVRSLRDQREPRIPTGWEPASIPRRVLALVIDLAPAAMLVKWLTGAPWSGVLTPPALVIDTEAALPAFGVILASVSMSAACEAFSSRSLGKWIAGIRVIDARGPSGARATPLQVIARNIFKAVILELPALGLFTLIDPLRQGIGESVSGTAVVRRGAMPSPAPVEAG